MRHIALLILCLCVPAVGQDASRAEVFGGYSWLHIDTEGVSGSTLDNLCNSALGVGTCPPGTFQVHNGFNGWNAAVQGNFNQWFGVAGDFSGHYATPVTISSQGQAALQALGINVTPPTANSYSFLGGPVLASRGSRFTVFGHALFGANRVAATLKGFQVSSSNIQGIINIPGVTQSDTAFAMAFGGGLDANISKQFSLRVGQVDYLYTSHGSGMHQNNIRASAGIVIRFGSARKGEAQERRASVPTTPKPSSPASTRQDPGAQKGMMVASLGVVVAPTDENRGARVVNVVRGSPAAVVGIHVDDVIDSINGTNVRTPDDLASALSGARVGNPVKIGYLIRGEWQTEATIAPDVR